MIACTRTELQRHILRQQCLSTPADSVEEAVTRILGCRAAEGSTPYLSLAWRVKGFMMTDFDTAVHRRRTLLRVKGPRGTYFWVTPAQAPLFLAAAYDGSLSDFLHRWGVSDAEYQAIREEVTGAVMGQPIGLQELKKRIPTVLQRPVHRRGAPASTALMVTLEAMQLSGQVTFLKEPGFERHRCREYYGDARDISRPNLVGLVAELYPSVKVDPWERTEARRRLVLEYVRRYGPVALEDIVWWTGWTKGEVRGHLRSLESELSELYVEGLTGSFLVHKPTWDPGDDPTPDGSPSVYLLPGGDSLMKGYAAFERFLARRSDDPNVLRFMPVVLVDGLGEGNWGYRLTQDKAEVVLELFELPEEARLRPMREAAGRMIEFITGGAMPAEIFTRQRTGRWDPKASFPVVGE